MTIALRGSLTYVGRSSTTVTASNASATVGDIVLFSINGSGYIIGTPSGLTSLSLLLTNANNDNYYMATVTAASWSVTVNGNGSYAVTAWGEFYASYPCTWAVNLTGTADYTGSSNTMNAPWLVDSHADSIYWSTFNSAAHKGGAGSSNTTAATGFSNDTISIYCSILCNVGPVSNSVAPYITFGTSYLNTSSLTAIWTALTIVASPLSSTPPITVISQAVNRASRY